jgi:hypothetical protein
MVDDVDNKHLRQNIREWITSNVPRNKQPYVRAANFDTLWALIPASTRSQMKHTEEAYERGSKEPPGGDVAESDHEGEVNNDILRNLDLEVRRPIIEETVMLPRSGRLLFRSSPQNKNHPRRTDRRSFMATARTRWTTRSTATSPSTRLAI